MKGHSSLEKPAKLPESSQEYLIWLIKIGQLITKRLNNLLTPFDLTFNQVSVLFILKQCTMMQKNLSMHELSEFLNVSLANTSGLVDRLERDSMVKRERKGNDRRTYYLELTQKGNALVEELQSHWPPPGMKDIDEMFSGLSSQDKKSLTTTLVKLSGLLHKSDKC